jgi:molybdenum cofactor cytidylyltransferase
MNRTPHSNSIELGVVLLAAGLSQRMGRQKILLPWGDTSILGHLVKQWKSHHAKQLVVVYRPEQHDIIQELDRLLLTDRERIPNPHAIEGMFSSIRCAAQWEHWDPCLTHWVVALGDQPHLKTQSLSELLQFAKNQPTKICQPIWKNRPKHPVLLPQSFFSLLRETPSKTFQEFLTSFDAQRSFCPVDDAGLDLDIDEPRDYDEAWKLHLSN